MMKNFKRLVAGTLVAVFIGGGTVMVQGVGRGGFNSMPDAQIEAIDGSTSDAQIQSIDGSTPDGIGRPGGGVHGKLANSTVVPTSYQSWAG